MGLNKFDVSDGRGSIEEGNIVGRLELVVPIHDTGGTHDPEVLRYL